MEFLALATTYGPEGFAGLCAGVGAYLAARKNTKTMQREIRMAVRLELENLNDAVLNLRRRVDALEGAARRRVSLSAVPTPPEHD